MIINDQGIPIAKSRYYHTPSVRDRLNDARRAEMEPDHAGLCVLDTGLIEQATQEIAELGEAVRKADRLTRDRLDEEWKSYQGALDDLLWERLERVTDAAFDSASCNITMDMPNMTEDEKIAFNKILDALRTAYRGVTA
jgi:hypothetical protein